MELRNKLCALFSNALRRAEQKNHAIAEKNRLKSAIGRAQRGRDLAYLNLGKYYYRNGKSDDHTRIYFERIERAENRIQKARDALCVAAGRSASAQKKTQQIPPALRLTLETEAIVSQIEQETDMILLSEKPQTDLIGEESKNQLLAVAAPTDEAEECAFENDGNIPWE